MGNGWKQPAIGLLALVAVLPWEASASEFRTGRMFTLPAGETVSENLYVTAGQVTISGNVEGDLVSAGGDVILTGNVFEDIVIVGGTVTLIGHSSGDVRVAGGKVVVSGHVGGDLITAGGQVRLLPGAVVDGDLFAAGGQVEISGTIDGDVHATGGAVGIYDAVSGNVQAQAGSLTIGSKARIAGGLAYQSATKAEIQEGATIGGPVTFHQVSALDRQAWRRWLRQVGLVIAILVFLMTLAAGIFGFLVFRKKSQTLVQHTLRHFGSELLRGFVLFVVIPVVLFLAAVTVVGLPLATLGGLLYFGATIIAGVYAGIVFGSLLFQLLAQGAEYEVTGRTVLVGITLLFLVSLVPILGPVAVAVLFLAVLGSLFHFLWQGIRPQPAPVQPSTPGTG